MIHFGLLFLSALCRRIARTDAGHEIQCANDRIFGIGDASPRCRRRLGRASRAQARGGSLLLTFQIGGRGSRHRRPLPDRPPTLQAFRSVLSETRHSPLARLSPRPFGLGPQSKAFRRLPFGFNPTAHQRLPFVPPSPRSSIPRSSDIIP